ncbi:hypothetical protein [Streptomyces sp. NRRL S-813]|uniref:hypothetical protein n=1 Tax=Streptomyces sp. NRRL S-813 TaxID=1463919 RepID=UPI000ADFDD2F|nr:hypothetical protein [Streptomyces sp. NRRL S-813]
MDWLLKEFGAGKPKRKGEDMDVGPLAASAVGMTRAAGQLKDASGRLAEDHPIVQQLTLAKWKLLERGLSPQRNRRGRGGTVPPDA